MPSLVGTFGEAPLIGKTLATFSDISWAFREIAEAVEIVKKISGNDARDVNRKNRDRVARPARRAVPDHG
jgi:hypothetical protein